MLISISNGIFVGLVSQRDASTFGSVYDLWCNGTRTMAQRFELTCVLIYQWTIGCMAYSKFFTYLQVRHITHKTIFLVYLINDNTLCMNIQAYMRS